MLGLDRYTLLSTELFKWLMLMTHMMTQIVLAMTHPIQ